MVIVIQKKMDCDILKETKEFIAILQERLEKHDYYINRGLQLWEKVKLHPMVKTFLR